MSPTDNLILENIEEFAENNAIIPSETKTLADIAKQSVVGVFPLRDTLLPVVSFAKILKYLNISVDSKTPATVALTRTGYLPLNQNQYQPFNFAYQR